MRLRKIFLIAFSTGILGLAAILHPFAESLEQSGLDLLFHLRGARKPPPEVVVIAIDNRSARAFNLQPARKWPRDLHARMVEALARNGAKVIAFDLFMEDEQSAEGDRRLAGAMAYAGNVVLCQALVSRIRHLDEWQTARGQFASLEQLISPIPLFADSAAALGPFPLPLVSSKLRTCWTFKLEAGECPTMPVVAFSVFNFDLLEALADRLHLPANTQTESPAHRIDQLVRGFQETVKSNPQPAEEIVHEMEEHYASDQGTLRRLRSLLPVYQAPETVFLNFYGPPGTITHLSYIDALRSLEDPEGKKVFDFGGKAVFVGAVDLQLLGQKDSFHTVFSRPDGTDLCGVEIAATAFANFFESAVVRPLGMFAQVAIMSACALLCSAVCFLLPGFFSALILTLAAGLWLGIAEYQFARHAVWFPLIVPWLVQAPAAFFVSVLWKYRETNKERQKITKAFGLYIPDSVVDNVVKDLTTHRTPGQMVFGAVMFSGGERLTSLSESTLPLELSRFMNSYYETMFNLVRRHGGTVSDVMGDSMLALWAMVDPDPGLRLSSCRAALEIIAEMGEFKCESAPYGLKTRIGLHYGPLLIGTIGGRDHYEYRPVGEVVNTAARIESLNKRLGTRVLVSGDVLSGDSGFFLVRKLGDFVLAGKSKVIEIYELMARKEAATNRQLRLAKLFVEGLSAFREQRLDEAVRAFDACLETGEDGPANYYIDLCRNAVQRPSGAIWDGAIRLEEK